MTNANASREMPLFRPEALGSKRTEWLGSIQLALPISSWIVSALGLALVVAFVALLTLGHYTRREQVVGQLTPDKGLLSVSHPTAGTVMRVWVREGQTVKKGDSLIDISGELESAALGGTRALIINQLSMQRIRLERDLDNQRHLSDDQGRGLRIHLVTLRDQLLQIDAQLDLQSRQTASTQELLHKIGPLREKGYVSAVQVQQEEAAVLSAQMQFRALERQRLDVKQQIDDTQQQIAQLPLTLASKQNDIHGALSEIDQQLAQNEAQRAAVLRAPAAGIVSTLLVDPGQAVAAGETLLTLLPRGSSLEAELLVPSDSIGFVRPGDRVVLRYRAYPYQKFGQYYGKVAEISHSALTPSEAATIMGHPASEPLYRVMVKLDMSSVVAYGKVEPLKAGMVLDADILQGRQRLIDWVFEPLYGLGQRLDHGSGTS